MSSDSCNPCNIRIAIIGAGVVGLSTAVQCLMMYPHAHVTVMADKFQRQTTSYGAGGIFRPTVAKTPGVDICTLRTWLRDSWEHLHSLAHSVDAADAGVQVVSGYQFYNKTQENPLEKEFVYQYRPLTETEMSMFPGTDTAEKGYFVTTIMTEGGPYIAYLQQRFEVMGGKLVHRKLLSITELAGQYHVIVNCTGLGSYDLLGDKKLQPIRGQLLLVKAPWIKHTILFGDAQLCFVYPGRELVIVGCTRQVDDWDLEVRSEDTERMWSDACRLLPSLEKAERVAVWVGLRPHRNPLRLEREIMNGPGNVKLQVVHNYGHGAEGVSLSWGTAKHSVNLVREVLEESQPQTVKSRL